MRLPLLTTSGLIIAALVIGVLAGRWTKKAPPEPKDGGVQSLASQTSSPTGPASPDLRWSQVEAADYPAYIAKLRKVGCPEQTVRDIIIADICSLYSQEWKRKHLASKSHFWDPEYGMGLIQSEEIQKAAGEAEALLRQNIRELLGVDLDKELEKYRAIGTTHLGEEFLLSDVLSADKAEAAAKALGNYRLQRTALETNNFLTLDQVRNMKASRENMRRDLQGILSPAEILQMDYRCSEEAQEVRDKMAGFDLSEAEFRALYGRRLELREQFENSVASGADRLAGSPDALLRLAAETELNEEQIRAVLTPERYAEYQRSRDAQYQQLKNAAAQMSLSPDWVRALYDYQRTEEEHDKTLRENPNLSPDEKETALAEARQRAQQQLRVWLGDELSRKLQPILNVPH